MSLKHLQSALTRAPFLARAVGDALPEFLAPTVASAGATRDLLLFGHSESAMRQSQLEALRAAVAANPERVRGVIVGLPLGAVERTLNSVGFDTAQRLHSISAERKTLRFRDAEHGQLWHVAASEFARFAKPPEFQPGAICEVPEPIRFNDWLPAAGNRLRHRTAARAVPRPTRFVFEQAFTVPARHAYDGLTFVDSPAMLRERLRRLNPALGLNASIFLNALVTLVRAANRPLDTPTLHFLICDTEERMRLIEYITAQPEAPAGEEKAARIREALETVWEMHRNVPKMASGVADQLFIEACRGREFVPVDDLLLPGTLWHIDTRTATDRYTAFSLLEDFRRRLLRESPSGETTLIFSGEWSMTDSPDLDAGCLARPDIFVCHATNKGASLVTKHGDAMRGVMRAFPRKHWHVTPSDAEISLFAELHPNVANPRQHIAYLPTDHRLEATVDSLREVPVDLDVDGTGAHERERHTHLRQIIDRGGFAVD